MTDTPQLADALKTADLLFDRSTLDEKISAMAARIDADYAGDRPLFLTVMNGGMFFAAQLALAMRTELEFDYLHATRYRGRNQGGELVWKHRPATSLYGRRVLVVDDILDEGHTLEEVGRWCLEQGATDVRIATLAVKRHDRCVEGVRADYAGVEVPDRYVFGFGMDYHEQGRNLPAIYALKE